VAAGALALAAAAGAGPAGAHAAAVAVDGDPLVHTFDLDRPGDAVAGAWRVTATGSSPVPFDGALAAEHPVPAALAQALAVEYGRTDAAGRLLDWHPAGTLADPVTYGNALARDPRVQAGEPVVVPVRVSLPDPAAVDGVPGEVLEVRASFVVSWLGEGPPAVVVDERGPLRPAVRFAVTGTATAAAALAAGALLGAGAALGRRARRPPDGRVR